MSGESLMDLYDTNPDRFRREVEKLRDRAILPPPKDMKAAEAGSFKWTPPPPHRVSVDAEFLLGLLLLVERQMKADGRTPLGPGPYDVAGAL